MIKLLLNEFRYSWLIWVLLFIPLPVYSGFALADYQLLSGPAFDVDYWGGMYSFLMSFIYIFFWIQSSKENRVRLYRSLPVSQDQVAGYHFYFHSIPMLIILLYLVIFHLVILSNWHAETSSIIGQTGLLFGIFAALYVGRDLWLLTEYQNKIIRVFYSILPVGWIVLSTIALLIILPFLYNIGNQGLSLVIFYYSKILFYVNAVIMLMVLPITYKKRKSFLA